MKKMLFAALVALFAAGTASAQDAGKWSVGPQASLYANLNDTVFGIGATARYSFTDHWRLQPSITALCHKGCSVDVSADVHYIVPVVDSWQVYPLAGLSVNDFGEASLGINIGAGADFNIARNWDLSAGLKWMIETHKDWKNPLVISIGASYMF